MGTSSSGGGPGDGIQMAPSWALPSGGGANGCNDAPSDDQAPHDGDGSDRVDATRDETSGGDKTSDDPGATPTVVTASPPRNWASARRHFGSIASGQGGRRRIASAGKAYVRARGGARSASHSAVSARSATARLGRFLADVATHGIGPALESLGLGNLVGRDAQTVFAAITDALAPEGADLEQVSARNAIGQTLAGLFEQYVGPDGDVSTLEAMTPDAIRSAIEASVASSIFNRWLGDLERRLEEKAVSAAQAVKLERDVEAYVHDTVKLDLQSMDPLRMQWDGPEGHAFADRIYQDAHSILGGPR